jgi:hypothetical protein
MKESEERHVQFDSIYISALAERIKRPDIPLPRLVPQLQRGKASVSCLIAEFFSRNVPDAGSSEFSRVRLLRELLDRNENNVSPSSLCYPKCSHICFNLRKCFSLFLLSIRMG